MPVVRDPEAWGWREELRAVAAGSGELGAMSSIVL